MTEKTQNKGEPQPGNVDSEKKPPTGTLRQKFHEILDSRLNQLVKEGVDISPDSETDSVLLSSIEKENNFLKLTLWTSMVDMPLEDLTDFLKKKKIEIDTLEITNMEGYDKQSKKQS